MAGSEGQLVNASWAQSQIIPISSAALRSRPHGSASPSSGALLRHGTQRNGRGAADLRQHGHHCARSSSLAQRRPHGARRGRGQLHQLVSSTAARVALECRLGARHPQHGPQCQRFVLVVSPGGDGVRSVCASVRSVRPHDERRVPHDLGLRKHDVVSHQHLFEQLHQLHHVDLRAFVRGGQTLCALSPAAADTLFTLQQRDGPMWSLDGQIGDTFDPQLFQVGDSNTTVFMLAQRGTWDMSDEVCPNAAQFIAPCREVDATEVDDNISRPMWCEPIMDMGVTNFGNGGSSSSSSGSSSALPADTSLTSVDSSSFSTGAIAGVVVGCVAVVACLVALILRRRGKKADMYSRTGSSGSSVGGSGSMGGVWGDDAIVFARIPREKVLIQKLLSRGGYGEVYLGTFNGRLIAAKMLLPETRKSIRHVNDFLNEVKMMAAMDHPRIVEFVGVAWDSLADLCVVSEYKEGGDLRAWLSGQQDQQQPVGFSHDKVKIALHVAHALTYLHSLAPPVIHRDLKSKNILLSQELDAKLTDFGVSRERVDRTMIAGVGTSLWMAPEVMMGEKYDDKADMFSFGVVLSELDLHTLPYSHAKENSESGHKMPDTAILQLVAMGRLRVEFSPGGLESMVKLGMACTSVDPTERPTAAEALYKLSTVLAHEVLTVRESSIQSSALV